jgi:glycosyltransferase involved in cell wall biosynthesis
MKQTTSIRGPFHDELYKELNTYLDEQKKRFPEEDVLKIDLHCHDHNSNVPDELLGRILHLPETWLETGTLQKTLKGNGCNVITITNHNNARSCFELLDKGMDVLTGAEFSCTVPDFHIGIHVLTYGFDCEQENQLNKLRRNLYAFQEFTRENNLPTIWAHPLYYYSKNGLPPMDFFHKMVLMFERFEVLNGQRDTWQNMLVKIWIESLTENKINDYANKFRIDPLKYCKNPFKKSLSGGSDSHMGIFSGQTGTYLYVPDLRRRMKNEKPSMLALEAIREGRMAPYGSHQNSEKLTIAFLDYVFQIALYRQDPGLLRILLHKGTPRDKIHALLISNAFAELRRHKVTMNFIEFVHNCFLGKKPVFTKRLFTPQVYKPVFDDAVKIADARNKKPDNIVEVFSESITSMNNRLNNILFKRLTKKIEQYKLDHKTTRFNLPEIIEKFELPSELRTYLDIKERKTIEKKDSSLMAPNIPEFLDGLSFPFLGSALILAANYTSARVLYNTRPLLQTFSEHLNRFQHPNRMLWLTDTFDDNNGVSMVLKAMHKEIKTQNLPIDIMVCSKTLKPDEHLIVLKPTAEFSIPFYQQQTFRIPNFLEIHNLFHEKEYDRIICSTEGPMGLAALYLKNAYSVKAYFYLHSDWIMFAKKVLVMEQSNLSRFRRLLRAYYREFDGLFVLNRDQQKWLTGRHMGFDPKKVFLTAHWADEKFYRRRTTKTEAFDLPLESKVLLFAGRVSLEKGVMELPDIFEQLRTKIPDLKIVIAGSGPADLELKKALPSAVFLGWIDHDELPTIYSAADLLILPSRFDTFSCVVLEAMSCGLPVIAYNTKGPKDIIENEKNGFVVATRQEMIQRIVTYFNNKEQQKSFRSSSVRRSKFYSKIKIMNRFLSDTGLA